MEGTSAWLLPAPWSTAQASESKDPVFVPVNCAPSAGCHWSVDEVAFVSTEDAAKEALACQVPSLVRLAGKGDLASVLELLNRGEDPDIEDDFGLTALHCSAKKGHAKIVELLLERGAKVSPSARNWKGEMPIHYACKYGHTKVLRILLSSRADPHVLTQDGQSPFDLAKERSHTACLEALASGETP
ncbi:unnamed protein product [Effrenium voratum]|nr:unnamed protein product [Effrenium voratum]